MKFGEKLKSIRKEKGYTQKDIYTILEVSPNCYASWEQGRTQPDIENIKRLCLIFKVSADYLLGFEDEFGQKNYFEEFQYNDGTHLITHKKRK